MTVSNLGLYACCMFSDFLLVQRPLACIYFSGKQKGKQRAPQHFAADHTHKEPCTKIARAGACFYLPISQ